MCIINLSSFLRTTCTQLNQAYIRTKWTIPNIPPVTAYVSDIIGWQGPAVLVTPFSTNFSKKALGVSHPLGSFSVLQFPQVNDNYYQGQYASTTPNAWACALYFCVSTYAIDITNGQLSSTLLSVWYNSTGTPVPYVQEAYTPAMEYTSMADLYMQRPNNASLAAVQNFNSTFWVPKNTVSTLADYLAHFFNIELIAAVGDSGIGGGPFINDTAQPFTNQNLSANVSEKMQGMATTMTNYIRTAGTSQHDWDKVVNGTSYRIVPIVQVSWVWLALPGALLISSAIFLMVTAYLSHKAKLPIWKNSGLPTLFHGLEEDSLNTAYARSRAETLDDMKQLVKSMRVTLEKHPGTQWELRKGGIPLKDEISLKDNPPREGLDIDLKRS